MALVWPTTAHGTGGTEVAPDVKHRTSVEVIDGAGGRISG